MLRNPHVATDYSSVTDRVLNVRNWRHIELLSYRLAALEAGFATSVEKAFVNLRFNDLSTSAHAGDSIFSRGFLTSARHHGVLNSLTLASKGTVYETPEVASRR
jgi:hypothetical protein